MRNVQKALEVIKKGAGRDLGLFLFMLAFGIVAALILFPVIWLLQFLPDWGWCALGAAWLIWFIFGDTIAKAWSAYRGDPS